MTESDNMRRDVLGQVISKGDIVIHFGWRIKEVIGFTPKKVKVKDYNETRGRAKWTTKGTNVDSGSLLVINKIFADIRLENDS